MPIKKEGPYWYLIPLTFKKLFKTFLFRQAFPDSTLSWFNLLFNTAIFFLSLFMLMFTDIIFICLILYWLICTLSCYSIVCIMITQRHHWQGLGWQSFFSVTWACAERSLMGCCGADAPLTPLLQTAWWALNCYAKEPEVSEEDCSES